MKSRTWLLVAPLVAVAMLPGLAGCDEGSSEADSEYSESEYEYDDSPEGRARQNSAEGEAALAESDRGVDEEGEKTWKQDAREYFDRQKNPNNRTFEMPWQWAKEFTERLYAAGAEKVWVTRIFGDDFDGTVINMSDDLLIVLPDDAAKRKAVFALYNGEMEYEEMQYPDVGQKYIFIVAD